VRAWRNTRTQSFRRRLGWLLRLVLILLAIAIVLVLLSAYLHALKGAFPQVGSGIIGQ
jgi:hypothetical protein